MTKLDRDADELTVQFKDPDEELVFKALQVRPLAWVKKAAALEASAVASLENKRQLPLDSLQQGLSEEAMARPSCHWVEARFVTDSYMLGSGYVTALVDVKEEVPIEWEAGDMVEVLMDHLRKSNNWRKATFMRYLTEPESVQVRLEESNSRIVITDRRLLRKAQPEPKQLPMESEVRFVDAIEVPPPPTPSMDGTELKRMRMAGSNLSHGILHPPQPMPLPIPAPIGSSFANPNAQRPPPPQMPSAMHYGPQFGLGARVLVRYSNQNVPGQIVKHKIHPQTGAPIFTVLHEINNQTTDVDITRLIPMMNRGPVVQNMGMPSQQQLMASQQQQQHQAAFQQQQQNLAARFPQQQQGGPVGASPGQPPRGMTFYGMMQPGFPGSAHRAPFMMPPPQQQQQQQQQSPFAPNPNYGHPQMQGFAPRLPQQYGVPSVLPPLSIPPSLQEENGRGPESPNQ